MHDASRLHRHHVDPQDSEVRSRASRSLALAVLCLCAFTTAVDMTISNVALPFIGSELRASTSDLQWVIDSYNIVLAGLLVFAGGLADRIGRRTVFLGAYAVFGGACLLAAFAPSVGLLIAARALMGVGAAGVIAPALAIVATLYAPDERGGAIAVWAVFGAAGLAVGPIAGGFLLDDFWWGSVFLVNVPFVALGVIAGIATIPQSRKPDAARLDVVGAAISVLGLGAVLFGIIEGPSRGWLTIDVLGPIVVGVALIAAFVHRELRSDNPLFDVCILERRVVAAGSVTLFVAYVVFTGMLFLVPLQLQEVRGESIVSVGLLLVPFAAVFGIASMSSSRVMAMLGPRITISLGLGLTALGFAVLAVTMDAALAWFIIGTAVIGIGLSGLIAPASTVVMNDLPESKAGDGSSLNMVSRFVGAAAGVAVVGSVLAEVYSSHISDSLAGLPSARAADANDSITGALSVAGELGGSAGAQLAAAARDAFDAGARAASWLVVVIAALAAMWASWALRRAGAPRD